MADLCKSGVSGWMGPKIPGVHCCSGSNNNNNSFNGIFEMPCHSFNSAKWPRGTRGSLSPAFGSAWYPT